MYSFPFFLFFFLYGTLNGYPTIHGDVARIIGGINLRYDPIGIVSTAILIKPFYLAFGLWGCFIFNVLITSIALTMFKVKLFNNASISIFLLAALLSMHGFVVLILNFDSFTMVGILMLFLILEKKGGYLVYALFIIATCGHHAHFPLYFLVGVVYAFLFKEKKLIVKLVILVSVSLFLNVFYSYIASGKPKLFSPMGYVHIGTKMLIDNPESASQFAFEHGDNTIGKNAKSFVYHASKLDFNDLMWRPFSPVNNLTYKKKNEEFKQYVFFNIRHNFLFVFKQSFINAINQLLLVTAHEKEKKKFYPIFIERYDNQRLVDYKNSLFHKNELKKYTTNKLTSIILNILLLLSGLFIYRHNKNLKVLSYRFLTFSILILVFNAFIMGNLAGVDPRYSARVLFCFFLAAFLLIYNQLDQIKSKLNKK